MCYPSNHQNKETHEKKRQLLTGSSRNFGISFGFWNIHGLGSKLDDRDFTSEIEGFDFFTLLETWHTGGELSFPNCLYFTSYRTKSKKAKRYSGGRLFI